MDEFKFGVTSPKGTARRESLVRNLPLLSVTAQVTMSCELSLHAKSMLASPSQRDASSTKIKSILTFYTPPRHDAGGHEIELLSSYAHSPGPLNVAETRGCLGIERHLVGTWIRFGCRNSTCGKVHVP